MHRRPCGCLFWGTPGPLEQGRGAPGLYGSLRSQRDTVLESRASSPGGLPGAGQWTFSGRERMCPRGGEGEDGAPSRCQLLSPLLPPPRRRWALSWGPRSWGLGEEASRRFGRGREETPLTVGKIAWDPVRSWGSGVTQGAGDPAAGQTQSIEGRVGGRQNEASRGGIRNFEPLVLLRSAARREPRALCFLCPKPSPP